jgi:hypothetical protein
MNLIVSQRAEDQHLRFDVHGQWGYNDALTLAYQVKAAGVRTRLYRVLIDLRNVTSSPTVEGKFLVWDRLRRALPGHYKVALLAPLDLIDLHERDIQGAATVVLFTSERAALVWLEGGWEPRKNPSVLRAEGQVAGKET